MTLVESRQNDLIRAMKTRERLEIANSLYETAWQIKTSALHLRHPDWSEQTIAEKTRRIFQTGYADA